MSGVPNRVERRRGRPAEELQRRRDELRREWERRTSGGGGEQDVSTNAGLRSMRNNCFGTLPVARRYP